MACVRSITSGIIGASGLDKRVLKFVPKKCEIMATGIRISSENLDFTSSFLWINFKVSKASFSVTTTWVYTVFGIKEKRD